MRKGSATAKRAEALENVIGLTHEMVHRSDLQLLRVAPDLVQALEIVYRYARAERRTLSN